MVDSAVDNKRLKLTAQIVSAYVSNNPIDMDVLPPLIQDVYRTLTEIGKTPTEPDRPTPAVPIRKSVFSDHIVCLEDGKPLKMLKRHLKAVYNLSPEQYRERWGLPPDYPMVAPDYAALRSDLAKQIGLGTQSRGRR